MPVPRRLDRRPPEQDLTRTNERISAPEVRLIDQEGQQIGVLKTPEALRIAQERELDLVEVAPQARPPVARVLDYSKYKYEQAQKQKQARKHQQQITVREIKFRPKIAQHDYDTKKGHVARFLLHKYKVKVTIMFRGREVAHPERGVAILDRLAEELSELGVVEQSPTLDGRNMAMLLAPSKGVLSGHADTQQTSANGAPQAAEEGSAEDGGAHDGAAADGKPAESASEVAAVQPVAADADQATSASKRAKPAAAPAGERPREEGSASKDGPGSSSRAKGKPAPASESKGAASRATGAGERAGDGKAPRKRTPAPSRAS